MIQILIICHSCYLHVIKKYETTKDNIFIKHGMGEPEFLFDYFHTLLRSFFGFATIPIFNMMLPLYIYRMDSARGTRSDRGGESHPVCCSWICLAWLQEQPFGTPCIAMPRAKTHSVRFAVCRARISPAPTRWEAAVNPKPCLARQLLALGSGRQN